MSVDAARNDESTLPADPAALPPGAGGGLPRGSAVGRFLVLDELGAGGMGRVHAAYDPELDRRVALKLLRPGRTHDVEDASARLLREAQTMARVSHPNVVAIFDVGLFDDQVFLAMELIDGPNLAEWLAAAPRRWRDATAMYVMAGRGLAAAHAAGVIHRDFKPSNVIVRGAVAKVADFGLAKPSGQAGDDATPGPSPTSASSVGDLTDPGAVVGTPRYMAPEQREGRADARADQYSFCRALGEALDASVDTAPRALRRVVERGLRARPEERYRAMDDVLAAIEGATRRRIWIAAAAVGVAAVAGVVGAAVLAAGSPPGDPCASSARRLAGVWDAAVRDHHAGRFAGLGAGGPVAFGVIGSVLDDYAGRWTAMHRETCAATHVRHEQSPALLDLRMACLDERRAELTALVGELAAVEVATVPAMVQAVHRLSALAACADATSLLAPTWPEAASARAQVATVRGELAAARAVGHVGRFGDALPRATAAAAQARASGIRPLLAEALLEEGMLALQAGHADDGEARLREAVWMAEASRHDRVAAEGWVMLVYAVVQQGTALERAAELGTRAEAALERLGGDPDLRARLSNHQGAIAYLGGDYAGARDAWTRALAETRGFLPADDPDVARVENNLGIALDALGENAAAEAHYRSAIAIWQRALGPDHPHVAAALNNLGSLVRARGQADEAIALYRQAIGILERSVGPEHPGLADPLINLGNALLPQRAYAEAVALYRRALAVRERAFGAASPQVAQVLASLGSAYREQGDPERALGELERALAIQTAAHGADHPTTAITITALGEVQLTRGRPAEARPRFAAALAVFEKAHGRAHPTTAYAIAGLGRALLGLGEVGPARALLEEAVAIRQGAGDPQVLAEAQFALAQALWRSGERARAWTLVEAARPVLARGHVDPDLQLGAWLAAHPR